MKECKVLKLAGESGLRKPGTLYRETDERAEMLASRGIVKIVKPPKPKEEPEVKEEKAKYETKEEKRKPDTKGRKRKS